LSKKEVVQFFAPPTRDRATLLNRLEKKKNMYVRLLGTAAGGGFPQWNCNCTHCRGMRSGLLRAQPRTQSCVAISGDNKRWFLLNASPDLRLQIEAFGPLAPPADALRGTAIAATFLTDADLDHTLGLFLLREGLQQTIYATATVRNALTEGLSLLPVLSHYCHVEWYEPSLECAPLLYADGSSSGLLYSAFPLPDKPPRYMDHTVGHTGGDRLGYRFIDAMTGGRLLFMPGISAFDASVLAQVYDCDALLLDGTFWNEYEMQIMVGGTSSATQMGHLPVGGPEGSLAHIAHLDIPRKIYVHINNTNPMLIEDSPEHAAVVAAGVEVGWDGLAFTL
jgi:pyrroloquinoline quinone biosynthesis protein B